MRNYKKENFSKGQTVFIYVGETLQGTVSRALRITSRSGK